MNTTHKRKYEEIEGEGEETMLSRNVKPRIETTECDAAKVFNIPELFSLIMSNLERSYRRHKTPFGCCFELDACYCEHAFSFSCMRMVSKSTKNACEKYKRALILEKMKRFTHASLTEDVREGMFKMNFGMLWSYASSEGYLSCLKFADSMKAPIMPSDPDEFNMNTFRNIYMPMKHPLEYPYEVPHNAAMNAAFMAASGGHFDCMDYILDKGCGLDILIIGERIRNGWNEDITTIQSHTLTERHIAFILACAVLSGDIETLRTLLKVYTDKLILDGRYANKKIVYIGEIALRCAAFIGRIDMLELLFDYGSKCRVPLKLCGYAALNGHLECLRYLIDKKIPIENALVEAARGGNVECLKFLWDDNSIEGTFEESVRNNNKECADYIISKIRTPTVDQMVAAAEANNLEYVKILREKGCNWSKRVTEAASVHEDATLFKYLLEQGCPADEDSYLYISINALEHARSHKVPWNDWTLAHFIEEDYPYHVRYALENGCQMSTECCSAAAIKGNLQMLKLLREYGCPWNWDVIDEANKNIQRKKRSDCEVYRQIIMYAIENNCPLTTI